MSTDTLATGTASEKTGTTSEKTVLVRAHGTVVKRLGHWTDDRQFDMRVSRGTVVLDLRSPRIAAGDIEVRLDIDHATLKLLVPDGALIDDGEARRDGRHPTIDDPSR